MQKVSPYRVEVLLPEVLDVDQGALPGAINVVLQGADHDVVGFGIH